jgi:hypothetical protein
VDRRERDWVLGEFKAGRSPILIATDVASRGLGMLSYFFKILLGARPCLALFDEDSDPPVGGAHNPLFEAFVTEAMKSIHAETTDVPSPLSR